MIVQYVLNVFYDFLFPENPLERWSNERSLVFPFLVVVYACICLRIGPEFMKNRKPYNIKTVIILYDVIQVISNAYLFRKFFPVAFSPNWKFHCPDDKAAVAEMIEDKLATVVWNLLLIKYFDLLDTIFFILRKKDGHVSALHVSHHIVVAISMYYYTLFDHTLINFFPPMTLNCGVHAFMYAYYGLSAMGFSSPTKLKKMVTFLQITQFTLIVIYLNVLFFGGCFSFSVTNTLLLGFILYLLFMFLKIFKNESRKKSESSTNEKRSLKDDVFTRINGKLTSKIHRQNGVR